jgi:hypothetical protein
MMVTLDSVGDLGPAAYPWGFPILLPPFLLAFGLSLLLLKTVNLVFFALSLVPAWMGPGCPSSLEIRKYSASCGRRTVIASSFSVKAAALTMPLRSWLTLS